MEKDEKFQKGKIEIGELSYFNKNCWLVKNLNYAPYKRCQYCDLKFRNCLFLQYQIVSLFLMFFTFTLFLLIEKRISVLAIITVFVLIIVYGYFFNKSTEKIIIANFSQKRAKDALKELTDKLEQKVDEQTKDIKDKNVRLQELLKMKSDFLTVASHQLRTPTSIVRGMLSLVCEEEGLPNEEREKFIHQAYEGINRLERIIHDLLNATELEGKRMHLDFQKTQVEEVVKEAFDGLMPLAKEKKLNLILDVPKKPLPKITLDFLKLKEAVANLIDNAIYYTPSGEVKVSVVKDGDKVKIVVKDTGIGMSKNDQKNLFKKFVRGEGILQIHPNGSGLGLFIAKKMLEAMNGTIEATSEGKGKGSVFTIGLKIR